MVGEEGICISLGKNGVARRVFEAHEMGDEVGFGGVCC